MLEEVDATNHVMKPFNCITYKSSTIFLRRHIGPTDDVAPQISYPSKVIQNEALA